MVDTPDLAHSFAIQRISTVDQVATLLRDKVVRGELRPGTPLQEVALANKIGISRNTMREAIRLLVHEGLLRHSVRRGVSVTSLTVEDVEDIYRVRMRLELDAVEATRGLPPDQTKPLDVVEELERALLVQAPDWNAGVEWDMTFHRRLVAFLGSARLNHFYRTLLAELRLGLVLLDRSASDAKELVMEHKGLYELVRSGQQDECKEHLREHLKNAERDLRKVLEAPPAGGSNESRS